MVGICIKYMHENYGGILPAYATISYLENQNIKYELKWAFKNFSNEKLYNCSI